VTNRRVRLEGKYAIHHAIPAGNGGCSIVRDDIDRGWLMREVRQEVRQRGWLLIAFCLMDTHLHLLIETPEPDLSVGIGRIQGRYARRFNKRHGSHGALFQQRYWSRRIDSAGYLVRVAIYVALNRVKPQICTHPSEWIWSSYRETAGLEAPSGLLDLSRLYAILGEGHGQGRREYVALVDEGLARMVEGADPAWEAAGLLVDDRFGPDARGPRVTPG
jgi:putative transposase